MFCSLLLVFYFFWPFQPISKVAKAITWTVVTNMLWEFWKGAHVNFVASKIKSIAAHLWVPTPSLENTALENSVKNKTCRNQVCFMDQATSVPDSEFRLTFSVKPKTLSFPLSRSNIFWTGLNLPLETGPRSYSGTDWQHHTSADICDLGLTLITSIVNTSYIRNVPWGAGETVDWGYITKDIWCENMSHCGMSWCVSTLTGYVYSPAATVSNNSKAS